MNILIALKQFNGGYCVSKKLRYVLLLSDESPPGLVPSLEEQNKVLEEIYYRGELDYKSYFGFGKYSNI